MAGMSLDEYSKYQHAFYSEGGTGAIYHKQDLAAQQATTDAVNKQTTQLTRIADALEALAPKA